MRGRLLVVKLGGSVATEKDRAYTPRLGLLRAYARLFRRLVENGWRLLVVLGGGSYGHQAVVDSRDSGAPPPEALHLITSVMLELALLAADVFGGEGVYTVVYPPHSFCNPEGLRPRCTWSLVENALKLGVVPLTYGDAYPTGGGYAIVSGDELAAEAACKLQADLLVYATSVDGVYVGGRVAKQLDRAALVEVVGRVGGSSHRDVTGGMRRKLEAILVNGCQRLRVYILNGFDPGNLEAVVRGEHRGTLVTL